VERGGAVSDARRIITKAAGHQLESEILSQVRDLFRMKGWEVYRHHQTMGSHRGFPDLTALKDGTTWYLEIKTAKGKLSEHQQRFQSTCEAHGGTYLVLRSLEAALAVLGMEEG
jgi:hypothetical protein